MSLPLLEALLRICQAGKQIARPVAGDKAKGFCLQL